MGRADLTRKFVEGKIDEGLVHCLGHDGDEGRRGCLINTAKWIYQLWVMAEIAKILGIERFQCWPFSKSCWWIEQSKPYPAFVGENKCGDLFTFFFEP